MKKTKKKTVASDKSIYRLYNPENGKYVSNIQPGWWSGKGSKILYSNTAKSIILTENDLVRFYKKLFELKSNLVKFKSESKNNSNAGYHPYRQFSSPQEEQEHIEHLEEIIRIADGLKLQQFNLVPSVDDKKLSDFKSRSVARLMKTLVKHHFNHVYGWVVAEWLIKDIEKKQTKLPYAIIEFKQFHDDKFHKEMEKKLESLGVTVKWFSRYSNQLEIDNAGDYHLICMSLDKSDISRKFVVSDLIDDYNSTRKNIEEFAKKKW